MTDPDAILRKLRILTANATNGVTTDIVEIAALFQQLDSWIASGGDLPRTWEPEE